MTLSTPCRDCGGPQEQIVIMDRDGGSMGNHVLEYRALDARRSFWTGRFDKTGEVLAAMCMACGRIRLYGSNPRGREQARGQLSISGGGGELSDVDPD